MYSVLCDIIREKLGEDALLPLLQNLGEDKLYDFLQNIFYSDDVSEIIECLITSENEEVYWFLWDKLMNVINDIENPCEATQKMLEKFKKEYVNWQNTVFNATEPVYTERLILSPMDNESSEILQKTVEDEGEAFGFIGSLRIFANTDRVNFKIQRSDTNELIGYIALCHNKSWGACHTDFTYNIEYYITPKNRRKGYLTEAVKKICELISDKQIKVRNDFEHKYIITEMQLRIDMIKLTCNEENIASRNCAKTLGFEYEGTLSFILDDKIYRSCIFSKIFLQNFHSNI